MPREERLANNEVLFREINERIAEVAEPHTGSRDEHVYEFLCECSNVGCDLRLPLTLSVYEAVRQDPTHFVVAPGHELPEIESVIARDRAVTRSCGSRARRPSSPKRRIRELRP